MARSNKLNIYIYISNWICQKVAAKIAKTGHFCCRHQVQKTFHPTPVLWSHNCHSPTHCTLWPYSYWWSKANLHSGLHWTRINSLGMLHCIVWLKEATYSECTQSLKTTTPHPCAFDTKLSATHPLLEQSLGCLKMQALTASPLGFERPQ